LVRNHHKFLFGYSELYFAGRAADQSQARRPLERRIKGTAMTSDLVGGGGSGCGAVGPGGRCGGAEDGDDGGAAAGEVELLAGGVSRGWASQAAAP